MSTVIVLTPVIIANWPAITAAITAAVVSMGFAAARENQAETKEQAAARARADAQRRAEHVAQAEIEVAESEILANAAGDEETMVVEREGIRATFRRDARGALRVCLEGKGYSKAQLRQIGEEMIDRVTQQYVYHRVVSELKQREMTILDEEVAADRTVTIRVRHG